MTGVRAKVKVALVPSTVPEGTSPVTNEPEPVLGVCQVAVVELVAVKT